MIRLRYGYIANLICCLIISLVIGATFSSLTRQFIIKDITYNNSIVLTYEFIKEPGTIKIATYDEDNNPNTVHKIYREEIRKQYTSTVNIPFVYSHHVAFSIEPNENLLAIHKLLVNGEEIELHDITHIFKLSRGISAAYSKDYQALIIHNQTNTNELSFDDSFNRLIKLSPSEMSDLEEIYLFSKRAYLLFCCFIVAILTISIMNYLSKRRAIVLFYIFTLFSTLLGISMSFLKVNYQNMRELHDGDFWGNVFIVEQNISPLIYAIVILPLIIVSLIKNKYIKHIFMLIATISVIAISLDNFMMMNFHTHFLFSESLTFLKLMKYLPLFIENYLRTSTGIYMILGIILFGISCSICYRHLISGGHISLVIAIVIGIFMLGWGFYPRPSFYEDYKFNNVFQANGISTFSTGNYTKPFKEHYEPRDTLSLEWKNQKGKNQGKNVILVVIESLDCSITFSCGIDNNLLPNLEILAKNNLSFDNYYSNSYDSTGAYLSIIKSIPYLPNKNVFKNDKTSKILKLYEENDLVNKLNNEGYTTKYISAEPLIFNMDKAITLSNWSKIITSESRDFNWATQRYVYDSVSDADLYAKVKKLAMKETSPFFYYVKTSSTSTPNVTPSAKFNYEESYRYADQNLNDFINYLDENNYFKNGIVIITGDHKIWGNPKVLSAPENLMDQHKVPLIIIDGKNKEQVNHNYFSHSSLGVLIQSLLLKEYKTNKFNADPLKIDQHEVILHYEYDKANIVLASIGDKTAQIKVNGNKSSFVNHIFTPQQEKDILGFIALCHE